MAKEIERKWLFNYDKFNVYDFCKDMDHYEIKDHYFNKYCRLRNVSGGVWFITIKSEGNLIRDEFEFMIDNEDIDFVPTPVLAKTRYLTDTYNNYSYEINVFRDVLLTSMGFALPLVIVEKEYDSPYIVGEDLPEFCGKEITNDERYYGFNLFNIVKEGTANRLQTDKSKDNIIFLKDYVDKRK